MGITKHRVGLEFEFELNFELNFELQFELILSVVTIISDTFRILQATCLTVRAISDTVYLVNRSGGKCGYGLRINCADKFCG